MIYAWYDIDKTSFVYRYKYLERIVRSIFHTFIIYKDNIPLFKSFVLVLCEFCTISHVVLYDPILVQNSYKIRWDFVRVLYDWNINFRTWVNMCHFWICYRFLLWHKASLKSLYHWFLLIKDNKRWVETRYVILCIVS